MDLEAQIFTRFESVQAETLKNGILAFTFEIGGGTPSVLNPFWKSWIFKKEHFSKNIYPYLGTPIHQIARKSTNRTYVPCLEKKLEIKILKTQKVTVVGTCTFWDDYFSEMIKIQGFLLRASRGGSYVRTQ